MFKLTEKQSEAAKIINTHPKDLPLYLMLYGGSQSAKTSFICYYFQMCAIKYPKSTAVICRRRFTHLKATIFLQTFPRMMELRFGSLAHNPKFIKYNSAPPMTATFFNGSTIFFIGLEDNYNSEKVLGNTFSRFEIDEASEIGYSSFSKLTTRLSENRGGLKVGAVALNPPTIFHWTYVEFIEKKNPIEKTPLTSPECFRELQMNPIDNLENLPDGYIQNLENLSKSDRDRFLDGTFSTTQSGSVYSEELKVLIDSNRVSDKVLFMRHYDTYVALDIGWGDNTSAWVFQMLPGGHISFLLFYEKNKTTIIAFLEELRAEFVKLYKEFPRPIIAVLPHDANAHWVGNGLSVKHILNMHNASVFTQSPQDVWAFRVIKKREPWEGINAVRTMFCKFWFHSVNCRIGLERLAQYKYEIDDALNSFKKDPIHDANSHCADALRYAVSCFYFAKPFTQDFERNEGQMYGADLLSQETKRRFNV
jgi:hypothetical protein